MLSPPETRVWLRDVAALQTPFQPDRGAVVAHRGGPCRLRGGGRGAARRRRA